MLDNSIAVRIKAVSCILDVISSEDILDMAEEREGLLALGLDVDLFKKDADFMRCSRVPDWRVSYKELAVKLPEDIECKEEEIELLYY